MVRVKGFTHPMVTYVRVGGIDPKGTPMHPSQWNWLKIGLFFAMLPIVAGAAYVSFIHIYDVAYTHGQNGVSSFIAPISVDGLIMVGYLKNKAVMGAISLWRRIWCPIAIYGGLAVSLAANMESSHFVHPITTAVAGWPALSLFVGIKVMGIRVPKLRDLVQAIGELVNPPVPVQTTPIVEKPVKATKAATPAKKVAAPRKRTPAKKADQTDNMFGKAVIDETALQLS
jgi:hypothetical protein